MRQRCSSLSWRRAYRVDMLRRILLRCSMVLLLLLFWGRALTNARDQSPIVDEPVHLTRGMAYWQTGDLRLQYGHPPLPHALIGSFLTLDPAFPAPDDMPGWSEARRIDIAQHILWDGDRPVDRLLLLGRWPVLGLALLLCALSYRWTAELFNPLAGVTALILITFDPNILAHASLATTDLTVTCLTFAACYAFSLWLDQPTITRASLAGTTLGLAWGAKLSSLILLPVLGLALVRYIWQQKGHFLDTLLKSTIMLSAALLTLWAIYRFEVGQAAGVWLPMPTHWENLETLWQLQELGHIAFFCGQISHQGWWYYFPALFLIKTPIPLLILLLGATVKAVYRRQSMLPTVVLVFPALYFAASMISNINIGYRHILPVLPFLLVGAASTFDNRFLRFRWRTVIQVGMMTWLAISSLLIHPYYLAYFNESVGGPDAGYRYAVDSNLDWGQNLKRLARYVQTNHVGKLHLSYFGTADPDHYLSSYEMLDVAPFESTGPNFHPFDPSAGTYAISASHLQGLGLSDADIFDWFRRQEPVAKIGYSIFIYRVNADGASWAGICYAPAAPLEPEKIAVGFGRTDIRTVYFDCRSSWVYPREGGPGWYAVPGQSEGPVLVDRFLQKDMIVFKGDPMTARPALTIYRWDGRSDPLAQISQLPSADANERTFGSFVRFLGSRSSRAQVSAGESATVHTYWEILRAPHTRVSIFAHLTDDAGSLIAQSDGLGVTVENWQPRDIIVQAHEFNIPADTSEGSYTPLIGWYHEASLERIPLIDSSGHALALAPLHVEAP